MGHLGRFQGGANTSVSCWGSENGAHARGRQLPGRTHNAKLHWFRRVEAGRPADQETPAACPPSRLPREPDEVRQWRRSETNAVPHRWCARTISGSSGFFNSSRRKDDRLRPQLVHRRGQRRRRVHRRDFLDHEARRDRIRALTLVLVGDVHRVETRAVECFQGFVEEALVLIDVGGVGCDCPRGQGAYGGAEFFVLLRQYIRRPCGSRRNRGRTCGRAGPRRPCAAAAAGERRAAP